MKLIDITGQRFGRLLVIRRANDKWNKPAWECVCDCGKTTIVPGSNLRAKTITPTRSCGCLAAQLAGKRMRERLTSHGLGRTRMYKSWHSMISRCCDPSHAAYKNYGGRGISVCESLKSTPTNMMRLIGERPPKYSIDRIDNNAHYSCGQCDECLRNGWSKNIRWATNLRQHRNTRRNKYITIGQETLCASEWAERAGIPVSCLYGRVKAGWSKESLLNPV